MQRAEFASAGAGGAWRGAARALAVAGIAGLLAGCAGTSSDKLAEVVLGPKADPLPATGRIPTQACPEVDLREGTTTHTVYAGDKQPVNVRYQAVVSNVARECSIEGNTMYIKVGIQGRVLTGPKGGPGRLDAPLRIAVARPDQPGALWSKFYRIGATVPPGDTQGEFTLIEDGVSFPLPEIEDIDKYVVYVGFDPGGKENAPPRRRRR